MIVITQNRTFSLNLGTSNKNFETTKYSLERSFQKEKKSKKNVLSKFFRKTMRSNLNAIYAGSGLKDIGEFVPSSDDQGCDIIATLFSLV